MNQIANHSDYLLRLDLQQFSDDDTILPDDFQAEPRAEETIETGAELDNDNEHVETGEDTIPTEETEQSETPEQQLLRVKYNKEEMEIPIDEAIPLVQKGLNYDKLQERLQALESDPRLAFVEQLAQENGMEVNEYLEAVQRAREQQALNELIQNNIPEELAQEILESRREREERKRQEQAKKQEEAQHAEALEFFDYFKQVNGRDYDPKGNDLPDEVIEIQQEQGIPMKWAYMQWHNQQLQNKIKVLKQNAENIKRAPIGGTTTHGSTETASEDDFLRGFDSI